MASSTPVENKNFFKHVKDFPPIIDGKINAVKFIDATVGLLWIVENLGKLFAPVKYDMEGNIDKLKKLGFNAGSCLLESILTESSQGKPIATEGLLWLNRLEHDFNGPPADLTSEPRVDLILVIALFVQRLDHDFNGPPAILTSEWRVDLLLAIVLFGKRSLCFFEIVFEEIINYLHNKNFDVNMKKIYATAYEGSVKQYHNWVTQQIFALICRLAPTLHQLLRSIGVDHDMEAFKTRLTSFNITLHLVRCKIDDFYRDNNLFCER